MTQKNKPELLAPAGDLERLRGALDYGADAVYLGRESFSMRAAASNFHSAEQLHEAVALAHQYGRPGASGNGSEAGTGYGDPHVHPDRYCQLCHLSGSV